MRAPGAANDPTPVLTDDIELATVGTRHGRRCDDGVDLAAGDDASAGEQERVVEARRDLLEMMDDEDDRRRSAAGRQPGDGRDQVLATGDVEARVWLVEDEQVGVGHQGAGDERPLPFTAREAAVGALDQGAAAQPLEERPRSDPLVRRIPIPPRVEGAPGAGDHDLERRPIAAMRASRAAPARPIRARTSRTSKVPSRRASSSTSPSDGTR